MRELRRGEIERVDRHLPLSRLDQHMTEQSSYLVAWEQDRPVGHAHIAWTGTRAGVPEVQDVYVTPDCRRRGIATELARAAEELVSARGWLSISLSVSKDRNPEARRLYERLGYADAGIEPVRVQGTITLRGRSVAVDDTLLYLEKTLGPE